MVIVVNIFPRKMMTYLRISCQGFPKEIVDLLAPQRDTPCQGFPQEIIDQDCAVPTIQKKRRLLCQTLLTNGL